MAGSGTPLAKELGIKSGHRLALLEAPDGLEDRLEGLPSEVTIAPQIRGTADVILLFSVRAAAVKRATEVPCISTRQT